MSDHLHVYTGSGRCIRSVPYRDEGREHEGVPVGVLRALLDLGFTATEWNKAESAGLASLNGETHIVRIKADAMQRDMRAGGAAHMISSIHHGGTEISAHDAWLFPR